MCACGNPQGVCDQLGQVPWIGGVLAGACQTGENVLTGRSTLREVPVPVGQPRPPMELTPAYPVVYNESGGGIPMLAVAAVAALVVWRVLKK